MIAERSAADTHAYIHDHGFLCADCDHRHAGALLNYICIGCTCERREPSMAEFNRMRSVVFDTDQPIRPESV